MAAASIGCGWYAIDQIASYGLALSLRARTIAPTLAFLSHFFSSLKVHIMFFSCAPNCSHPSHRKASAALARSRTATTQVSPKRKDSKTSVPKIDIHCHYLNPAVAQKAAILKPIEQEVGHIFANDLTRKVNFKQMQDRAPRLSDLPTRLKDMDRQGVDIQVVSPAPFQYYYFAPPKFGAELASDVNDGIAEIVASRPDRFMGFGTVPLQDPDLAVQELIRAVKKLGLKGVEINTHVNGKNLTDPSLGLEKFFKKAEELGAIIFIHPNGFSDAQRLTNHYFNNIIGNPLETTIAASHLIFDGVMHRYPKLKIVLAHAGGYLAHYWARMDHGHKRPDARTVITRKPSSYLKKFYFDTVAFDPELLANLIRKFGSDHVLLGTDYPYDMGEEDPVGLIASVPGLGKEDRALIMGGNAARLLKVRKKR
jgi:aminocarboxymuconate-semialdehyde decarboxylase